VRVLDPEGIDVATRDVGLVYFLPPGGAGSTYAYRGAVGKRTEDGWETFGDLGYLDEDGFLYLTDRETDMIVSAGANVYPAEVEAAIDAYESVRSSAVIGRLRGRETSRAFERPARTVQGPSELRARRGAPARRCGETAASGTAGSPPRRVWIASRSSGAGRPAI